MLTGMNYDNKTALYEEIMKSLKKFMGEIEGCRSESVNVKLEPAFLAEHEEVFLAAGYVKSKPGYFGKRGYQTKRG